MSVTIDRRAVVAHHEGAHAVAALALGQSVYCVALEPDGSGTFRRHPQSLPDLDDDVRSRARDVFVGDMHKSPVDEEWLHETLIVSLAGACATFRLTGNYAGCDVDFDDVDALLGLLPLNRREAMYRRAAEEAEGVVDRNWAAVERIAVRLLSQDYLDALEIRSTAGPLLPDQLQVRDSHIYPVFSGKTQIGEVLRRNVDGLTYAAIPAAGGVIGYFDDLIDAAHAVGAASPAGSIRFCAAEDDRHR